MRLPQLAGCALLGILPISVLPELPSPDTLKLAMPGVIALALFGRAGRAASLIGLLFCWGVFAAWQVLLPAQMLPGKNRHMEIVITQTDGQTSHRGAMLRLEGRRYFPQTEIALYGSYLPQAPCVGQRWQMTVSVRAVHGQLNDGGFDAQRYALSQNRPLTGRIVKAQPIDRRCSLRARFLASLQASLADLPWRDVMLALGLGERLSVAPEIKMLMQQTGTSHLMAISGLHIALGASLGWLFVRGVQFFLPGWLICWRLPSVVALFTAIGYAMLTGMQPPALRTVVAASMWYALRLSGRQWTAWEVWLCCLAAIVFIDPLAVLSDSLWLSVFAVGVLIFWYQWAPLPRGRFPRFLRPLASLIHLQIGLSLLLSPAQIALFHGISLTSLLANVVAVPVVTLLAVPLILLAMFLHLFAPDMIEMMVWRCANGVLALLFDYLQRLPTGWLNIGVAWLGVSLLPWLTVIVWRLHAWRCFPALWLSLAVLLSFPLWRKTPQDRWQVVMLDVGQGLAVVIVRGDKALLYDTGLAWPDGDSGEQLIVPWLRWHGLTLQGIVLSHDHLDHRGGLGSVQQAWPQTWIRSPLGWEGHLPCARGERWHWQGLTFRVLWPLAGKAPKGNNGSCVVKVSEGKNSILLTGDIEFPAEMAMISRFWQPFASTIIQVPHHGSSTSSGVAFIQRVGGAAALASASRYNAWRLPSSKIKARYLQHHYAWFDTPHQGQITVTFSANGWKIEGLRDQLLPRWYHQWFGETRDNG
ncbi:ComEC family protein [Kluyvera cryocrescens]|uniref:ComEC family protein n=1 Tax=Kluyvera cryocrescens TaxID=580 RepID=UPI0028BF3310|nr:ComEC family protein [Kluyvera cryocrescens]WNN70419.1 ComEC family protein [Kluyvera cryocrescens]